MLSKNQQAVINHDFSDWPAGNYYKWLIDTTNISKQNLLETFNCGIGLVISVDKADEEKALGALNQTLFAKTIGTIKEKGTGDNEIIFV